MLSVSPLLQTVIDEVKDKVRLRLVLNSVVDMTKGCDQLVYRFEAVNSACETSQVIVKIPHREKDKIEKQFLMAQKSESGGYNVSPILYHSTDFLVEAYLPGNSLCVETHGNDTAVWIGLGRQMKLLHSTNGATGYSNRLQGETCEKFPIFESYQDKVSNKLTWEDSSSTPARIGEYFACILPSLRKMQPVFLHYDVAFDNIIVSEDKTRVSLIDFADAGMGDPMEDFAFLCCFLHESPQLQYVIEGYGGISEEDRVLMEFFCVVWLTWALSGEEELQRRSHQLRVANAIISKYFDVVDNNDADSSGSVLPTIPLLGRVAESLKRELGIHLKLESVVDMSRGYDQQVYRVETESYQIPKLVIKFPRNEADKDKVEKQVIMAHKAALAGCNVSPILYYTTDFHVEAYLSGEPLSLELFCDRPFVWSELGRQMKLLHTMEGATGYSNRIEGESCQNLAIFSSYQDKMSMGVLWEDQDQTSTPKYVNEYYAQILPKVRSVKPVFLHRDIALDNIIVTHDDDRVCLIDFGDAGMGDPLDDFPRLYCALYGTPQLDLVIDGYGGVTEEDRLLMEFFCVIRIAWSLCGPHQPQYRDQQLRVANEIINKHIAVGYFIPGLDQ
jgi:aminoglycoside phosphotransferase (APT) family kinase protein